MKEYSHAIREEKQGRAIICYMDESFVNARLRKRFTWFSRNSVQRNEVGGPAGKGSREIIIHGMAKNGLVVATLRQTQIYLHACLADQNRLNTVLWAGTSETTTTRT